MDDGRILLCPPPPRQDETATFCRPGRHSVGRSELLTASPLPTSTSSSMTGVNPAPLMAWSSRPIVLTSPYASGTSSPVASSLIANSPSPMGIESDSTSSVAYSNAARAWPDVQSRARECARRR